MTEKQEMHLLEYYRNVSLMLHIARKDMMYAIEKNDEEALKLAMRKEAERCTEKYGFESALKILGYSIEPIDDHFHYELKEETK